MKFTLNLRMNYQYWEILSFYHVNNTDVKQLICTKDDRDKKIYNIRERQTNYPRELII